jgi:hypothetical protein
VPTPPSYNGEGDSEVYERWLSTLLRWLRMNKICGAEYDEEHIVYILMYLEGDALLWFNDNIDGFHCQQEYWTFKEVITGLYDHFVFCVATRDASDKFWSMAFQEGDDIMRHTNGVSARLLHLQISVDDEHAIGNVQLRD